MFEIAVELLVRVRYGDEWSGLMGPFDDGE